VRFWPRDLAVSSKPRQDFETLSRADQTETASVCFVMIIVYGPSPNCSWISRLLVCFQDLGSWKPGLDISPTHLCRGAIEARNLMTHQHYWLLEAPTNEPRPCLLLTSEHLAAHIRFRFHGTLSDWVVSSEFATPPASVTRGHWLPLRDRPGRKRSLRRVLLVHVPPPPLAPCEQAV
jgi:hypothetical protein